MARRLDGMDCPRLYRGAFRTVGLGYIILVFPWMWPSLESVHFLGWPLLAIADYDLVGSTLVLVGDEPRGWLSMGMRPTGVVAVGVQPTGVIAFGLFPVGVVSFGLIALGLFGVGGLAAGLISFGTVSAAWLSFASRLSIGWFALGMRAAIGVYAWGTRVRGLLYQGARSWETPKGATEETEEGIESVWRKRQGALPHLAERLDGTDARRLRRCVLWVGVGACVVAGAVSPLALSKSLASTEVLGWPLVAVGGYEFVGGRTVVAGEEPRAWISIGYRPRGVVAIGIQPTGVIALGFVPIGLIPVGLTALGLFPLGLGAAGFLANGVVSFGWIAFGRVACGWYALAKPAGGAVGAYAWGNIAHGLFSARRLSGTMVDNGSAGRREHIDHRQ